MMVANRPCPRIATVGRSYKGCDATSPVGASHARDNSTLNPRPPLIDVRIATMGRSYENRGAASPVGASHARDNATLNPRLPLFDAWIAPTEPLNTLPVGTSHARDSAPALPLRG